MCYLTKGLKIRFVDERDDQEYSFYFEGGIVSFVRHLNKNRQVVHQRPIYAERVDQRHQRRGRAPVLRRPERGRVLLRQQHQHDRRRHPPDGLPPGADAHAERLRPQGRHPQGQRPEPDRRGCPRGTDGDRQRQAAGAAVRGADEDPTRELRGHADRRVGDERGAGPVPRGEPVRRPANLRAVPARRARPRGRAEGEGAGDPQERAGRDGAARQARGLHREEPGAVRDLPGRGNLGWRLGEGRARSAIPGDPAAARQDPERRAGPHGQDARERRDPRDDHRPGRRDRRSARHLEAALQPRHHHERRGRGRQPHPDAAADVLLPPHAAARDGRPPVHRAAAAVRDRAGP